MERTPWSIEPADAATRELAVDLLFRRIPPRLRREMVECLLLDADQGTLDLSGLRVARLRHKLMGVILAQTQFDRTTAVWPPEVLQVERRERIGADLVRAVLAESAARGDLAAQALVDASVPADSAGCLDAGGLNRLTELIYLDREVAEPIRVDPAIPSLHWQSYQEVGEARFRDVLAAVHRDSLDLPELQGLRTVAEVLENRRHGWAYDSRDWWVGTLPNEPRSAVIAFLGAIPGTDAWELSDFGLTPPARGRGLGLRAVADILDRLRPRARRLQLAVDARNEPACKLYRRAAFTPFDRRTLHLRIHSRMESRSENYPSLPLQRGDGEPML